jgi:hypothetical protein
VRLLLLAALAACTRDPPCASNTSNAPLMIVSGTDVIGAAWNVVTTGLPDETHAVVIDADGGVGSEVRLAPNTVGVAGRTSVAWWVRQDDNECFRRFPTAELVLQRAHDFAFVEIQATEARSISVAFDGERYQVFWIASSDGAVRHRTLEEDGTLGPIHDLFHVSARCLAAASGNGTTLLRVDNVAHLVDADGGTQMIFNSTDARIFKETFWFAGQYHVYDGEFLFSFPPTPAEPTQRFFEGDRFVPGPDTFLVRTAEGVLVVDASLAIVRHLGFAPDFGMFGGDIVRFIQTRPDAIDVQRDAKWQTRIATLPSSDCSTLE